MEPENLLPDSLQAREMLSRSLEDLEFFKIIDRVSSFCCSQEGENILRSTGFFTEASELKRALDIVDELLNFWKKGGGDFNESFPGINSALEQGKRTGFHFDGEELFSAADYLSKADRLKRVFTSEEGSDDLPLITPVIEAFPDLGELRRELNSALEYPGNVRENHPRIKPLIRELEESRKKRSRTAAAYFRTHADIMQSDQAVVRDGRIVLPVKSGEKSQVQGIMHGSSGTGATLFMEPTDLIDRNNQVTIAEERIQIEIRAILRELSELLTAHLPQVERLQSLVGLLDTYLARARYSKAVRGIRPESDDSVILRLIKARHPLLKEAAVPIDITIEAGTQAMIMSGPNAGGKTVTLKTIGVFSLMHQFGLFIPADEGSVLPVFDQVLTDIGDDQSIEASLSTFSGHLSHIGEILQTVDRNRRSLVIFDELGSGTDPVEGAALARSILEYAIQRAMLTLVTSHHTVLKHYAYTSEGIMNASMEFDKRTKTPTFRVIAGLPGESYAIETAERMKLPGEVIERANSYLSEESVQISTIIKALETQRMEAAELRASLKERESQLREKSRNLDLKLLQVRQKEKLKKESDLTALGKFARDSRSRLENLVRELKEGELTREKTKQVRTYIRELTDRVEEEKEQFELETEEVEELPDAEIREGMKVKVLRSGRIGTIIRRERKRQWSVQIDSIKITLPESDLKPVQEQARKQASFYSGSDISKSARKPVLTLDVRGKTLDEAIELLETQIDNALVHNLTEFSVIHGKGDGILQSGIHAYLSRSASKGVAHYQFAAPEDGGFGKTIIELKN